MTVSLNSASYMSLWVLNATLAHATALVWSVATPMPTSRTELGAATAGNGKLYAIGGYNSSISGQALSIVEQYDPVANTWAARANMTLPREGLGVSAANNGKVYAVGGINYTVDGVGNVIGGTALASVEEYDPATNTWVTKANMPGGGRFYLGLTMGANGKLYAVGGSDINGTMLGRVEEYDPATNTWVTRASMPTPRAISAVASAQNGRIYVFGGFNPAFPNNGILATVEEYDPVTDTWTTKAAMPTPREGPVAVATAGKVYVIGGIPSTSGSSNLVEEYDPATNTWITQTNMPTPRSRAAAAVAGGAVFVIGGSGPGQGLPTVEKAVLPPPPDQAGPITSDVTIAPYPLPVNASASMTASVSDATTGGNTVNSVHYTINGGSTVPMLLSAVASTVTASATISPFSATGVYNVCARGTDSVGNSGADSCLLLPVYDPTGGFVTGGGIVASPAGADLANPSSVGPATFGFVSKYLPANSTPSGNLEFQFKAGNLNFKSTGMDWLVVTGQPRAIFRGTGTVNGAITCNFEVDAWDGSLGGMDGFGLKIFSCGSSGDRYNLFAAPLTRGSIVIHP